MQIKLYESIKIGHIYNFVSFFTLFHEQFYKSVEFLQMHHY